MSGYNTVTLLSHDENALATSVSGFWETENENRSVWRSRLAEIRQYLYATSTRETPNADKGGEDGKGWRHSTHVPQLARIKDTLVPNYERALFSNPDWLVFEGNDTKALTQKVREGITGYIKTKHRLSNFEETMSRLLDDFVEAGNSFARVFFTKEVITDPISKLPTNGYIGPTVERIDPLDIVFRARASSFDKSPVVIRSLKTFGEFIIDAQDKTLGYSQEAVENIKEFRGRIGSSDSVDVDKELQMNFDGFSSVSNYFASEMVEVLEFFGDIYDKEQEKVLKNHVITVVDKIHVVRNEQLDSLSGRRNIHHVGWRNRPNNLWAMSPLENLVGIQYMINHLRNGVADAMDKALFPTRVIVGQVTAPASPFDIGVDYEIPDGEGSVQNLPIDTTFLHGDLQINRLEQQMESFAGAPPELAGFRTPGEKTAFEVQTLRDNAIALFNSKTKKFESLFLEKIVNSELEVSVLNLDIIDVSKVIDSDTGIADFVKITADDLRANGRLIPVGAKHFVEKSLRVREFQGFQQLLNQDPEMRQHYSSVEMARMLEPLLGVNKSDVFEPYVRIEEAQEAQFRMNAANENLASQQDAMANAKENTDGNQANQPDNNS